MPYDDVLIGVLIGVPVGVVLGLLISKLLFPDGYKVESVLFERDQEGRIREIHYLNKGVEKG